MLRWSAMGPRMATGMNNNAPTIRIVPISTTPKSSVSVRNVPADSGGARFGDEIDLQIVRRLNKVLSLTAKAAFFDGEPGFADRDKYMVQADYAF